MSRTHCPNSMDVADIHDAKEFLEGRLQITGVVYSSDTSTVIASKIGTPEEVVQWYNNMTKVYKNILKQYPNN